LTLVDYEYIKQRKLKRKLKRQQKRISMVDKKKTSNNHLTNIIPVFVPYMMFLSWQKVYTPFKSFEH